MRRVPSNPSGSHVTSEVSGRTVVKVPLVGLEEIKGIDEFLQAINATATYHIGLTPYHSFNDLPWGQSFPQIVIQAYTNRGRFLLSSSVCVSLVPVLTPNFMEPATARGFVR